MYIKQALNHGYTRPDTQLPQALALGYPVYPPFNRRTGALT